MSSVSPVKKPIQKRRFDLDSIPFFSDAGSIPCSTPECNGIVPKIDAVSEKEFCDVCRCTYEEDGQRCHNPKTSGSNRCIEHKIAISSFTSDITQTTETLAEMSLVEDISAAEDITGSTIEHDGNNLFNQMSILPLKNRKESTSCKMTKEAKDAMTELKVFCLKPYGFQLENSAQITMGLYLVDQLVRNENIKKAVQEKLVKGIDEEGFIKLLWLEICHRIFEQTDVDL